MTLIADSEGVRALAAYLMQAETVTVDTEFMRERTFFPVLCLLQVAGPGGGYAIDALAPDIDLSPLRTLFAAPHVLKVLHSARQDIEIFLNLWGEIPRPLFDTQAAAAVCGYGDQVGLEPLLQRLTGQRLDKASRFTDWSRRPLTERQIDYALGDVLHLRAAYDKLAAELAESGRTAWLEEEMTTLLDPATYRGVPTEAWRRLKPRTSDRRALAVLREAAAWREAEAVARNLPRNWVIKDETLLELAAHPPADASALERLRGLSKGFGDSRAGQSLLAAVKRGLELPASEWPQPLEEPRLERGAGAVSDLLKVLLKHKCEQNKVAARLVASANELDQIAAGGDPDVPALKGWRREVFGADALRLVNGELALAIAGGGLALVELGPDGGAVVAATRLGAPRRRRRRGGRSVGSPLAPTNGTTPSEI
ncbi:MAG: ribonuclease D [Alphaproteobacteria bacterium]|nr:ribonuclease D [Alphaproteobacteria bacterium]